MTLIDKHALEFLGSEGERLRRCSYDELLLGIGSIPQVSLLAAPDGLDDYHFTITRAKRSDGAVRILLNGERSLFRGLGQTGCFDSFDKLPNDSVREIPESDGDYSGKG
jgi:hypothetical protein